MSLGRLLPWRGDAGEIDEPDDSLLDTDTRFHLLASERRREVVEYLHRNGRATLDELADYIAAIENGVEPWEVTSQQRKRVYVSLYQNHLPKLDGHGVVDYDQPRGRLVPDDALAELLELLETA